MVVELELELDLDLGRIRFLDTVCVTREYTRTFVKDKKDKKDEYEMA